MPDPGRQQGEISEVYAIGLGLRVPDPGCQQGAYGNADGEMPDLGSRASSPPTTCQVLLGGLWEEGHPEPLNQFKQEELVM